MHVNHKQVELQINNNSKTKQNKTNKQTNKQTNKTKQNKKSGYHVHKDQDSKPQNLRLLIFTSIIEI